MKNIILILALLGAIQINGQNDRDQFENFTSFKRFTIVFEGTFHHKKNKFKDQTRGKFTDFRGTVTVDLESSFVHLNLVEFYPKSLKKAEYRFHSDSIYWFYERCDDIKNNGIINGKDGYSIFYFGYYNKNREFKKSHEILFLHRLYVDPSDNEIYINIKEKNKWILFKARIYENK